MVSNRTIQLNRLLFLTRRIDRTDSRVGFVSAWVEELSRQLSAHGGQLSVVCWQDSALEGLPDGMVVNDAGTLPKPLRLIKYISLVARAVKLCDAVFVHQHPAYAVVAAVFVKFFRKKLFLWYVHKNVDLKLRMATRLVDGIFTASKESFRLETEKPIYIVGHGIDTELFKPGEHTPTYTSPFLGGGKEISLSPLKRGEIERGVSKFVVLSVGRISPIKGYELLIEAIQGLLATQPDNPVTARILGGVGLKEHQAYLERIQLLVKDKGLQGIVYFVGPKAHAETIIEYQRADVFINLSGTGALDKAVLEAMACGVPVVTSNEAYRDMLQSIDSNLFMTREPERVAQAIAYVQNLTSPQRSKLSSALREVVVRDHDLKKLCGRIIEVVSSRA